MPRSRSRRRREKGLCYKCHSRNRSMDWDGYVHAKCCKACDGSGRHSNECNSATDEANNAQIIELRHQIAELEKARDLLERDRDDERSHRQRLQHERYNLEATLICCVCKQRQANTVLQPCFHQKVCSECMLRIRSDFNQCPICSTVIVGSFLVLLA